MTFRTVFNAIVIGFGLIIGAFLFNGARPRIETDQTTAQNNMKEICNQCHTRTLIDRVYTQAGQIVNVTTSRVT